MSGIIVLRSSLLPPRTMCVSEDIYQMLQETPEQRTARTKTELESVAAILKKMQENSRELD